MSDISNDQLIDEARDYLNGGDVSSTPLEKLIEQDIERNDMESLWEHVQQARNMLGE